VDCVWELRAEFPLRFFFFNLKHSQKRSFLRLVTKDFLFSFVFLAENLHSCVRIRVCRNSLHRLIFSREFAICAVVFEYPKQSMCRRFLVKNTFMQSYIRVCRTKYVPSIFCQEYIRAFVFEYAKKVCIV
jgi:hypothetical protein